MNSTDTDRIDKTDVNPTIVTLNGSPTGTVTGNGLSGTVTGNGLSVNVTAGVTLNAYSLTLVAAPANLVTVTESATNKKFVTLALTGASEGNVTLTLTKSGGGNVTLSGQSKTLTSKDIKLALKTPTSETLKVYSATANVTVDSTNSTVTLTLESIKAEGILHNTLTITNVEITIPVEIKVAEERGQSKTISSVELTLPTTVTTRQSNLKLTATHSRDGQTLNITVTAQPDGQPGTNATVQPVDGKGFSPKNPGYCIYSVVDKGTTAKDIWANIGGKCEYVACYYKRPSGDSTNPTLLVLYLRTPGGTPERKYFGTQNAKNTTSTDPWKTLSEKVVHLSPFSRVHRLPRRSPFTARWQAISPSSLRSKDLWSLAHNDVHYGLTTSVTLIMLILHIHSTVFDGYDMPAKEEENKQRRERREAAREEALEMIRKNGGRVNTEIMRKCMQAIYVTPEIIFRVIGLCRKMGIQVVVAPYEADAQVAYLCRSGIASCAISEDSDLLAYGCPRVWYKLDKDGKASEITLPFQSIDAVVNKGFLKGLSHKMFIIMCVLSGTDYDDGSHIRGMGIKIAHKLVMQFGNIRNILSSLMVNPSWMNKLPTHLSINDLALHYERISSIFLHNIVYDITRDRLLHINSVSVVSTESGNTVHSYAFIIEMSRGIRSKCNNFRQVALGYVSAKSGLHVEAVESDDSELIKDIKFSPIKNVALEKISDAVCTKDELIDVPDYVLPDARMGDVVKGDGDSGVSTQVGKSEVSTESSSLFNAQNGQDLHRDHHNDHSIETHSEHHSGSFIKDEGAPSDDHAVSTPKARGRPRKAAKTTTSSRNRSLVSTDEGISSRVKSLRKRVKEDTESLSQDNKRLKSEYASVIKKIIDKSSKDEDTVGAPEVESLGKSRQDERRRSLRRRSSIKSEDGKLSRMESNESTRSNSALTRMNDQAIEDMTTTSSIEGVDDFKATQNVRELLNTTECLVVARRRGEDT